MFPALISRLPLPSAIPVIHLIQICSYRDFSIHGQGIAYTHTHTYTHTLSLIKWTITYHMLPAWHFAFIIYFLRILFQYGLLQDFEYSSLCYHNRTLLSIRSIYSLHLLVPNSQCIPSPPLLSFSIFFIIFPYHYIENFLFKFFFNWPFGLWELNSPAKDGACALGSESQSPNSWTTGEFPSLFIYFCMKIPDAFLLSFTDRKKKKSISNSAIYNVRIYF